MVAACFPLFAFSTLPLREFFIEARASSGTTMAAAGSTPVFLIVFDELPLSSLLDERREIAADLFPHFARLAHDSLWFPNATTVSERTRFAIPAILTGRYPSRLAADEASGERPASLFGLLEADYELNVFETTSRLCRTAACAREGRQRVASWRSLAADLALIWARTVGPRTLLDRLPTMQDGWAGFAAGRDGRWLPVSQWAEDASAAPARFAWHEPVGTFKTLLRSLDQYPRRTLHYLHLMLPHYPWRYHPDGHAVERSSGALQGGMWVGSTWQRAQELQAHLLQVGFVDTLLGALIGRLEQLGIYEESLLIVTSDHGTSFEPDGSRRFLRVQDRNRGAIANIPLFVKLPFERPRGADPRPAQTVDIVPTVLEILGASGAGEVFDRLDGRSLLAERSAGGKRRTRDQDSRQPDAIELRENDMAWPPTVVTWRESLFAQEGWPGVFAMGPFGHKVGRPVDGADLAVAGVEWIAPERLDSVDFGRERLPGWIEGRLQATDDCRWVAVVLNGRVEAVTLTRREGDADIFQALIDPRRLRPADNDLALSIVSPDPARPGSAARSWCRSAGRDR